MEIQTQQNKKRPIIYIILHSKGLEIIQEIRFIVTLHFIITLFVYNVNNLYIVNIFMQ